jgi:hypothetical protein
MDKLLATGLGLFTDIAFLVHHNLDNPGSGLSPAQKGYAHR